MGSVLLKQCFTSQQRECTSLVAARRCCCFRNDEGSVMNSGRDVILSPTRTVNRHD